VEKRVFVRPPFPFFTLASDPICVICFALVLLVVVSGMVRFVGLDCSPLEFPKVSFSPLYPLVCAIYMFSSNWVGFPWLLTSMFRFNHKTLFWLSLSDVVNCCVGARRSDLRLICNSLGSLIVLRAYLYALSVSRFVRVGSFTLRDVASLFWRLFVQLAMIFLATWNFTRWTWLGHMRISAIHSEFSSELLLRYVRFEFVHSELTPILSGWVNSCGRVDVAAVVFGWLTGLDLRNIIVFLSLYRFGLLRLFIVGACQWFVKRFHYTPCWTLALSWWPLRGVLSSSVGGSKSSVTVVTLFRCFLRVDLRVCLPYV